MLPVWKIDRIWTLIALHALGSLFFLVASFDVAAQDQAIPLSVEDALRTRVFGELMPIRFSRDGKRLAYAVTDRQRVKPADGEKWNSAGRLRFVAGDDIYVTDVDTGKTENLTQGEGDSWLPTWSPDGTRLAFLSDREAPGKARVWIWSLQTKQIKRTSDADFRTTQMEWTPDSKHLVLTMEPVTGESDSVGREDHVAPVQAQPSPAASTAVVYRSSEANPKAGSADPWDLESLRRDLVLLDAETGEVKRVVVNERISVFRLSPDGAQVAYSSPQHFVRAGTQQMNYSLLVANLKPPKASSVAVDVPLAYDGGGFNWSPNGREIAFRHSGPAERTFDIYVIRVGESVPRKVTEFVAREPRLNYESEVPLWDVEGSSLFFTHEGALWRTSVSAGKAEEVARIPGHSIDRLVSQAGQKLWVGPDRATLVVAEDEARKQEGVFAIQLGTGQVRTLMEKGECYSCQNTDEPLIASQATSKFAFFREDASHPRDLWMADSNFSNPTRLTHLNPQFDSYEFGEARLVNWQSDDGEILQGALLLPAGYRPGVRFPLVVWVYAGEELSNYRDHFGLSHGGPFNWQLLATRGYAVLLPDAPVHVGTPMLDLAKTVLPAVSRVVDLGIADPNRIGVAGHSHGGYSVLALIAQTTRFRCAVELSGFADLLTAYGEMQADGSAYFAPIAEGGTKRGLGGTPWSVRERYIENSPFLYLDRVETPLLVVHGALDRAVSAFLGDQLFVALRRLNKEVEYAKYDKEDHSPNYWSYPNQVDLDDRMIRWFDTHLKQ
jgi:dipeptidyl aminopeptidase/acylaminoacyl peptidase